MSENDRAQKGRVTPPIDESIIYDARCIHCGSTDHIQLWPFRNELGHFIGFVFGCEQCKKIIPNISFTIHGI